MHFNITEENGDKPIDDWMIRKIKEYAKKELGIILDVYKNEIDVEKEPSA